MIIVFLKVILSHQYYLATIHINIGKFRSIVMHIKTPIIIFKKFTKTSIDDIHTRSFYSRLNNSDLLSQQGKQWTTFLLAFSPYPLKDKLPNNSIQFFFFFIGQYNSLNHRFGYIKGFWKQWITTMVTGKFGISSFSF